MELYLRLPVLKAYLKRGIWGWDEGGLGSSLTAFCLRALTLIVFMRLPCLGLSYCMLLYNPTVYV